jgi:very-short-patch-repair endonuclease
MSIEYGAWCPYCKNKTERKLYEWLIQHYTNVIYQPRYNWCKNPNTGKVLPFDFEYNNIIIELDGPQHFHQISNWRTPEEQNAIDRYKMKCAIENNKHIIRILQYDVLRDMNSWEVTLTNTIEELLHVSTSEIRYIGVDPTYFE